MDKVIHYGATKFDPAKFIPIKNMEWMRVKPKGGLWTSPINSNYGWKHWCKENDYGKCDKKDSFILTLNKDARIYTIDCYTDLMGVPIIKHEIDYMNYAPDFEILAKTYDVIHLTEKGQWETRLSCPLTLYGWDCESVLIMNPNCFSEESNK